MPPVAYPYTKGSEARVMLAELSVERTYARCFSVANRGAKAQYTATNRAKSGSGSVRPGGKSAKLPPAAGMDFGDVHRSAVDGMALRFSGFDSQGGKS